MDTYRQYLKGLTQEQIELQHELMRNRASKDEKHLRMLQEELLRRHHTIGVGDIVMVEGVPWTVQRMLRKANDVVSPVISRTEGNVTTVKAAPFLTQYHLKQSLSPFELKPALGLSGPTNFFGLL
jgi:hypothetical protein